MAHEPPTCDLTIDSPTDASRGAIVVWAPPPAGAGGEKNWKLRYGEKHRMRRLTNWPAGIAPPGKVRVYRRHDHWLLQWWEPAARKNIAERVDGDLITAVGRARELDQRLTSYRRSGQVTRRIKHVDLVERFLKDLWARADAGEIQPRSVERYRSALRGHYLKFCDSPEATKKWPYAAGVNREFALGLAAFLRKRSVSPNGRGGSDTRPMKSDAFVLDAARALFAWAAHPDRGNAVGDGFRSPFLRNTSDRKLIRDPFGEPDVTLEMAGQLLGACDDYQLRLFAPFVLYGLRAAEPVYLFGEYLDEEWLRVPCNPKIAYTTKGKRDKRLPLFHPLKDLIGPAQPGLLFVRRRVAEGKEKPPLLGSPLARLEEEFRRRVTESSADSAAHRFKIRDAVLKEAGATSYDQIESEFGVLARRLTWPKAATLKDLRHLFATTIAAAGMPEPYRQYLMGHATSSAAIGAYTHLNRIREQYLAAVDRELRPLMTLLAHRTGRTVADPNTPDGVRTPENLRR
jgi:integrase